MAQRKRTTNAPRKSGRRRERSRGNNEGSIYQLPSGRWQAAMADPATGRRIRRNGATREAAADALKKLVSEIDAGVHSTNETVEAFLTWWLARIDIKVGNGELSPNTYGSKRAAVLPVIADHGKKRLRDLRSEHIEQTLERLADAGQARSTVRRVRSETSQALQVARARGKVLRNVAESAELPLTAPPEERGSLTVDGARRLLKALLAPLPNKRRSPYIHSLVRCLLIVGMTTGFRPGELLGLQWSNIDFSARALTVAGSWKRECATPTRASTRRLGDVKKGIRASRRSLALCPLAFDALEAHQRIQAEFVLHNPLNLVHSTSVGTLVNERNLGRVIDRILNEADLDHLSLNELSRHSAASFMDLAEVPMERAAQVLGQSSTRMLEKHYQHQLRNQLDAHLAIGALLGADDEAATGGAAPE